MNKKKMGRPPKKPKDLQTERVTVRLTQKDMTKLKREAALLGLNMAQTLLRAWKEK